MSQGELETNYVTCVICKQEVPLSCAIIDKGTIFPKLMRQEHKRHEIEVCIHCFEMAKSRKKYAYAA